MCGRFTLTATVHDILERFQVDNAFAPQAYAPSFNIAPSQQVLAVISDGAMNRIGYLRWGLIPSWAKDKKIGYKLINAQAETLGEKPSFRAAYKKQRCLIIADSFYEWQRLDDKRKIPMRIQLKSNALFSMAGLWETWQSPTGDTIHSCTIITTKPNALVSQVHDRMPVILQRSDESVWVHPKEQNFNVLDQLLKPYHSTEMEMYPVSSAVNSPKNNYPELIRKVR